MKLKRHYDLLPKAEFSGHKTILSDIIIAGKVSESEFFWSVFAHIGTEFILNTRKYRPGKTLNLNFLSKMSN